MSKLEAAKVAAETEAKRMLLMAQAKATAAEQKAQAAATYAVVERKEAAKLSKLRAHRERMQRCFSESDLSSKAHIVVAGQSSQQLLAFYSEAASLGKVTSQDDF
jgi:peptidyl-tRNA hydrolase